MTEEKNQETPQEEKETQEDKPEVIEEGEGENEVTRTACCTSGPKSFR